MNLPNHVGIIIDGNRRWARARGKHPWEGHNEGREVLKKILEHGYNRGIKHGTLYVWSLKNEAQRSKEEKGHFMKMFKEKFLKDALREAHKRRTRIRFLGRWEQMQGFKQEIERVMKDTEHYSEKSLNFCFMYDGQEEIVDACNEIIKKGIGSVDFSTFKNHLYTRDLPPMDLIIRTGMSDGCRLSGFMLWDASYAELIFHDILWPDYTAEQFDKDLEEFAKRNRRFGK
jgi:undecaprenyl diphosphate synthase